MGHVIFFKNTNKKHTIQINLTKSNNYFTCLLYIIYLQNDCFFY